VGFATWGARNGAWEVPFWTPPGGSLGYLGLLEPGPKDPEVPGVLLRSPGGFQDEDPVLEPWVQEDALEPLPDLSLEKVGVVVHAASEAAHRVVEVDHGHPLQAHGPVQGVKDPQGVLGHVVPGGEGVAGVQADLEGGVRHKPGELLKPRP